MSRKRKDIDGGLIEDQLCRYIREIPFRFIAANHKLDENFFLKKVYQDRRYSSFFLGSNCQKKFSEAAKVLMTHSLAQVQDMAQVKEDQKVKDKIQREEGLSYSNVLSSSLNEPQCNDPPSCDELFRLDNISPSALSEDFKSFIRIDFENDDTTIQSPEFGIYHSSLVSLFLQQMVYDEKIIVGIILYGNPSNPSIQKQQKVLYKKFSTSFCNDCNAPMSDDKGIIQFPEFPPLPQFNRTIWKPKSIKKS